MGRRALQTKRDRKVEVQLNPTEKEFLARASFNESVSMGEWFRNALPTTDEMKTKIVSLRLKQKGIKGILNDRIK